MLFQTKPHCVQAVTWTGESFNEFPWWMPAQVTVVRFAIAPLGKLYCSPPFAWYGCDHGPVRLAPGDHLVYEEGHGVKVWADEPFQEMFMCTPT